MSHPPDETPPPLAEESGVPLPPMRYDLWGTPDEAKELSPNIQKLLATMFGASADQVPRVPEPEVRLRPSAFSAADVEALAGIVGAPYVSTDRAQRLPRSRGKSYLDLLDWRSGEEISAPDAVVAPATDDEVLALLRWCAAGDVAVVPFGGGTSVVGGIQPDRGRHRAVVSVDLARFTEVSDVDVDSGLATLGAGLPGPHAELLLAEHGLQLGHFPQSFPYATIGGFAATRSAGQSSAGFGRFDEMVRAFTVVTPQGVLHVGAAAPASAAGPDLRELFLGSEGAFGIITRVRLRVHPLPETKEYEAFSFPDFDTGVAALRAVEQAGAAPTVLRLSDEIESAVNLAGGDKIGDATASAAGCLAVALFEGTADHVRRRHEEARDLLVRHGGTSLGDDAARAWEKGRFGAPVLRDGLLDNGALCETLETATDWSNAAALRAAVGEALAAQLSRGGAPALVMCHVSHVYATGCSLYFTIVSRQGEAPREQWRAVKDAVCRAIVAAGGTITHHHAVGVDHAPYLRDEIGELGVRVLSAVKRELDPAGICNPGKLLRE